MPLPLLFTRSKLLLDKIVTIFMQIIINYYLYSPRICMYVHWPDIRDFWISTYSERFGIGPDSVHGTVRMEFCAPDGLHVLQPGDSYESGLTLVSGAAAVSAAIQQSVTADIIGPGRFVAHGRRRRLKSNTMIKIPYIYRIPCNNYN